MRYDFLWHLRGSVDISDFGPNDEVLDRLEVVLDGQKKPVVARDASSLEFDDPLWRNPFGSGSLVLAIHDRGRFWIDHGLSGRLLRYDLRTLHGLVFCLFAAATFFLFGLAEGVGTGLKFGAGAFAWLYGMNVATSLVRVPRLIRKAARQEIGSA